MVSVHSKSTGKSRECVTQLKDFSSIRKWSRGRRARLLAKHLESTMCENSTLLCNLNERITFPKGGWVKWHSGCAKETLIIITVVYPDGGIVLKHMQINLNKSFLICAFCSPICPAPAFGSLTRLLRSTPSSCSPLFKIEILSGYLPFFVCIFSIRRLCFPTCSFENERSLIPIPIPCYTFSFALDSVGLYAQFTYAATYSLWSLVLLPVQHFPRIHFIPTKHEGPASFYFFYLSSWTLWVRSTCRIHLFDFIVVKYCEKWLRGKLNETICHDHGPWPWHSHLQSHSPSNIESKSNFEWFFVHNAFRSLKLCK